jgi:hypothetical protein
MDGPNNMTYIQCPAEFVPVTKLYISWTDIHRNMGTSLKDAGSFQVSSRARPVARVSTVFRQMDWGGVSYLMASQVTGFDPFRFFSMGVRRGLGVPNEGLRCRRTASWGCYTSYVAGHLPSGGVSWGHLSGHQGYTCGDLPRNIKTWKLSASFSEVPMFLPVLL